MIFLIGVDHQFQHDGNDVAEFISRRLDFEKFLESEILKIKPCLIAEEYSEEALVQGEWAKFNSVVKPIADKLGVEHRFCDPDRSQRDEYGIKTPAQREEFWLGRIKDKINDNLIFICGASHVATFASLLSRHQICSKIVGGDAWKCP